MKTEKRNIRIILNIVKVFGVKGVALLINLLAVPAYITYFSEENVLGVWYTILSMLSWILTFDLGIGNGLRNKLGYYVTRKNHVKAKEYITAGYVINISLMCVLGSGALFVLHYINWNAFFNIPSHIISSKKLYGVVVIIIICLLLQFILNIINSILYAIQEPSIPSFLVLCTSLINFTYAKIAPIKSVEINLLRFAIVYLFAVNVPLLVCTIVVFSRKLKSCRPNIKYFRFERLKEIMGLGGAFFLVQLSYLLIINTNEFLITKTSGPSKVVEYQIYYRIFSSIGMGISLALTPIWSAVTEAKAENNYKWISKIIKVLVGLGGLISIGILMIIPLFPYILKIWLGNKTFSINYYYVTLFAILSICLVFNGIYSNVANGLSELKTQVVCFSIGAIVHIVGSVIITELIESWIGVVLATILSILPYIIIQPIVLKKNIKRNCLIEME